MCCKLLNLTAKFCQLLNKHVWSMLYNNILDIFELLYFFQENYKIIICKYTKIQLVIIDLSQIITLTSFQQTRNIPQFSMINKVIVTLLQISTLLRKCHDNICMVLIE